MNFSAILSSVWGILVAAVVLGIMIFIHEFGHYLVGRLCKLKILEFAIGFGPKLVKWTRKGIVHSLRLLPIGGFVRFFGEDEDSDDPEAMNNQPVYKRFLSVLAGPFFNIIFALILAMLIFCVFGDYAPTVESITADAPAAESGLMVGDQIIAVDGREIFFADDASTYIAAGKDQVTLTVLRGGQKMNITSAYYYDQATQKNLIGITMNFSKRYFGFFEAIGYSFRWLWALVRMMLVFLGNLIFRWQGAGDVAGPVGTISIIGSAVQQSNFESLLRLGALLSVNLGVVNLVPFPALDGSRLVFLAIEGVRRKPVNRKTESVVHFVGLVVLLGLMVLLTINDIGRLVSG